MIRRRLRFKLRWLVLGCAVWLTLASSIGLEHGHGQLADIGTLVAVGMVGLLAAVLGLRIGGRGLTRATRRGWAAARRRVRARR